MKKETPISSSSVARINESVSDLTRSINSLIDLFKEANQQIKLEEKEQDIIEKRLVPIESKINILIEQNRKIAEGIIAVVDMLKAKEAEVKPFPGSMPKIRLPPLPPARRPMPAKGFAPSSPRGFPPPPKFGELPSLPPLTKESAPPLPPPPAFLEERKEKKKFPFFK